MLSGITAVRENR